MRSSIFNFESFRRYGALPRAEHRWHATIAAVLLLVLLLGSRVPALVFGRAGCAGGTIESAAVAALSDRTEVLFVGSSHVLFGIRPQRYSVDAMNLAAPWLDYASARRVVEKHLPRVPNLKVAVIEYDELPLVADMVSAMVGGHDLRALTELELPPLEFPVANWRQRLRVLYTAWLFPLIGLPRLTPRGLMDPSEACTPLQHPTRDFAAGYYFTNAVTPPGFDSTILFRALANAAQQEATVEKNLHDLDETIGLLRRRGVIVVLLRLPHSPDYALQRPAVVTARWRQLQDHFQHDTRVLALDWGEKTDFQAGDFCDNHHLNASGADKLARLLDPELRLLFRGTS
jgi:hypothetical protein